MTGRARTTPEFDLALQSLLDGPSLQRFRDVDLVEIKHLVEERWARGMVPLSDPYYRGLVGVGSTVAAWSVVAHLRPDGDIDLLTIAVDWQFDVDGS